MWSEKLSWAFNSDELKNNIKKQTKQNKQTVNHVYPLNIVKHWENSIIKILFDNFISVNFRLSGTKYLGE